MGVLMKSVSGIRGIVGDTLVPDLILSVGHAFSEFTKKGVVVIGRDSRPSGQAVSNMLQAALSFYGSQTVDLGIVPTPTVQIMVEELKAAGGIVVSASHNPIEWNAFKLIGRNGSFLNEQEIEKFFDLMEKKQKCADWDKLGGIYNNDNSFEVHLNKVLSVVKKNNIKKNSFKVALDSVNGAGSYITQELLEKLGCEVIPVHCEINGTFPRVAEPLAENLVALSEAVKKSKADIGFAQDPDADRLAIVDENGNPIGEEYTIALVADHLLSKRTGRVVVNMSTTKAVEDIAKKHKSEFIRSKVGEINVVEEMKKKETRIGGEGNGGVISPEVHYGRDSLAGIAYVLEMMTERKATISEIHARMPKYFMNKDKVSFNPKNLKSIYEKLKNDYQNERINDLDGLRLDFETHPDFKGGWVHLRPSNTEPVFRVISEGKTPDQAKAICGYFKKYIK